MNRSILHKQLSQRLEDLAERHQEMLKHTGSVPHQDINDFLNEIRTVYELALSLHHSNAISSMEQLEIAVAERYQEGKTEVANETIQAPQKKVATTTDEILVNAINRTIEAQQAAVHHATSGTEIHDLFDPGERIADQFHETVTLAEVVGEKATESRIAETLQHTPIKDLQHAIGINERFYYIQHLFHGNAGGFHLCVEKLNSQQTLADAMSCIKSEFAPKHSWDFQTQPVKNFIELIERRYIA
jgi:hypothetical protein